MCLEPGGRLGRHTDATEETQYIIAGKGELRMEDGRIAEARATFDRATTAAQALDSTELLVRAAFGDRADTRWP